MDNNSTWVYSDITGSQSSLWHILPPLEAKHNGRCWVYLPSVTAQDQTPFKTSSHTVNTARYNLSPPFIWTVLTTVSRQAFRKISVTFQSLTLFWHEQVLLLLKDGRKKEQHPWFSHLTENQEAFWCPSPIYVPPSWSQPSQAGFLVPWADDLVRILETGVEWAVALWGALHRQLLPWPSEVLQQWQTFLISKCCNIQTLSERERTLQHLGK